MRQRIDSAVFNAFPDYTRAVLIARDLDTDSGVADQAGRMMHQAGEEVRERFAGKGVSKHPRIACWRDAYEAFGMAEDDYPCSLEVSVQRVLEGHDITYPNPLADLLNAFSLQHLVPCLGDDVDRISGDVWLRLARGREFFTPIGGGKPTSPELGELIYVDSAEVILARRWNGQPGDQTRLTDRTRNAILNVDCLPPVRRDEAQHLADVLSGLVEQHFRGEVTTYLITRDQPVIEVEDLGEEPPPTRGQRIGG